MAGNTIGNYYTLTSFGESHGEAVGGVVDGCPSGLILSIGAVQAELNRRRPGASVMVTQRSEPDQLHILSGLFEGVTTGAPIGFLVYNRDASGKDYEELKEVYRPSHADYAWHQKYGIRDHRGGGRASAREHIARVVAGAIARQCLALLGVQIYAFTSQIGRVSLPRALDDLNPAALEGTELYCPDPETEAEMLAHLREVKESGDTVGGVVSGVIRGLPAGLGEPVFDRFQARLAHYMLSIQAAKGFEYGEGFRAALMRGSEHNDRWVENKDGLRTFTDHSGGIQGGVTNGRDLCFRVAFKPISSIALEQTAMTHHDRLCKISIRGRHDACVIPRVIPVVEAMAAMLTLDLAIEGGYFPRKINENSLR